MKKLCIPALFIIFGLLLIGCGGKVSRELDPPARLPDVTLSGKLYENNDYGFILVKPDDNWVYQGCPDPGLLSHAAPVVRFEKAITPTFSAFLEIAIWDVSEVVTPGMGLGALSLLDQELVSQNASSFPGNDIAAGVVFSNVNSQAAYSFAFTASPNYDLAQRNQYRCIGFLREYNYYIFLGGTNTADNWGVRNAELKQFIDSFYFK